MAEQNSFVIDKDRFEGITIDTKHITFESEEDFQAKLIASIALWRRDSVRGLWAKVWKQHSSVIPICAKAGFEFDHAKPGYVMMKTWLPTDEPDMLPNYANQFLGSAGFVINEEGQLLVVKERWCIPKHSRWKLPGGMSEAGEEIGEAARREVYEETGVEAEFVCILAFRHQHNFRYGCSDLYFVSLMKARTTEIKHCKQEIADCQWMDLDEYLSHDLTDANRYFAMKYKELLKSNNGPSLSPQKILSYNKKHKNLIYSLHNPVLKDASYNGIA